MASPMKGCGRFAHRARQSTFRRKDWDYYELVIARFADGSCARRAAMIRSSRSGLRSLRSTRMIRDRLPATVISFWHIPGGIRSFRHLPTRRRFWTVSWAAAS